MSPPAPTNRELEILKLLWRRERATVREIYDDLKPNEPGLAYTTVLSLLQIMEHKGLVGHEQSGKAYIYFARVKRESTLAGLARGFLDSVFDGAVGEYVARALDSQRPSLEELEQIERMIAGAKQQARKDIPPRRKRRTK
ncbi:MAG TPA: BlaI/MecI/CopY family transcriptional regulator [Pirellulales bacterium]|jgi:predicted transcriptional regulator|nr:BlaI/MecI/CopY family transcriptional regulator [Pirellulales bacterium]